MYYFFTDTVPKIPNVDDSRNVKYLRYNLQKYRCVRWITSPDQLSLWKLYYFLVNAVITRHTFCAIEFKRP